MEAKPKTKRGRIDRIRRALEFRNTWSFPASEGSLRRTGAVLRTFDVISTVVFQRETLGQDDHLVVETPDGKGAFGLPVQEFVAQLRSVAF